MSSEKLMTPAEIERATVERCAKVCADWFGDWPDGKDVSEEIRALPPIFGDVPAGWKLVPVEPTRAMLDAAHVNFRKDVEIDPLLKTSYRAMIAAAPTAGQADAKRKKSCIVLTGKDIRDIADSLIGLKIQDENYSEEYETEVIVAETDGFLLSDDGEEEYYKHIAYLAEYPEEGAIGLGEKLKPPMAAAPEVK